eukprot:9137050-Ditylum_brightwellii.AAC.1
MPQKAPASAESLNQNLEMLKKRLQLKMEEKQQKKMKLQLDSGDNENSKFIDNAGDDSAPGEAQLANEAEVDGLGMKENTRGKFSAQGESVDFTKPTSDAAVPSYPAATQDTITEEVCQDA